MDVFRAWERSLHNHSQWRVSLAPMKKLNDHRYHPIHEKIESQGTVRRPLAKEYYIACSEPDKHHLTPHKSFAVRRDFGAYPGLGLHILSKSKIQKQIKGSVKLKCRI